MANIESQDMALGTIFGYQEEISNINAFLEWLSEDHNFDVPDPQGETISVVQGQPMFHRGISLPGTIARKDNIEIIYNPKADLAGNLNKSSFVTVKDSQATDFDDIKDATEVIHRYFNDHGYMNDFAVYEITHEGKIRIEESNDSSAYFNREKLDEISQIFGTNANGNVARFEGDEDIDEPVDWFRMLINTNPTGHEKKWQFKIVERYNNVSDIDLQEINESLVRVIGLSEVSD